MNESNKCLSEGCVEAIYAKGLCSKHYHQQFDSLNYKRNTVAKKLQALDYFYNNHDKMLAQQRKYREMLKTSGVKCLVDGCQKPSFCRGMCSTHYNRQYASNKSTQLQKTRKDYYESHKEEILSVQKKYKKMMKMENV